MINILRVLLAMGLAVGLGKLLAKIKLPEILGWLIMGMIVGPYAFQLLNNDILDNTIYKIFLAIFECTLGLMIGTELVISKLKKSGKEIIITTLFQSIGTFLLVTLVYLST